MSYEYMGKTFACTECKKTYDIMQESHYVGVCEGCAYDLDHKTGKHRKKRNNFEHEEQVALFNWARAQENVYPELEFLHASPNGGLRHPKVAKDMKAEGVKGGVPDVCLPCSRRGYHGLYIENKVKGGTVSAKQKRWLAHLKAEGYFVAVSWEWESQAKQIILWYIGQESEYEPECS